MRGKALIWLLLVLPFHGCAFESLIFGDEYGYAPEVRYPSYAYSASSRSFDNPWVGKSRDELVEALGPPDAIYEARPKFMDYWKEGIPATTYVYGDTNGASGHCIDAYVVAKPTSTVIKYYCR
jgi:hypothetical protein